MANTSDCVVPDNDKVWSNSNSSNVNMIELSAPRLCFNPFTDAESQLTFHWHSSSPRGLHSPSSPASPRIVFFPDASTHTLVPSYTSANPFITCSSSSLVSQSLPIDTTANPHSVTYDTSRSLPIYLVPTNELDNTHSTHQLTPEYTPPSSSLHMHLHPQYMPPRHSHRHSFSEGESGSNSSMQTLSPQSHVRPIHGRRSLGSMLGSTRQQRRNSYGHMHHTSSSPSYGMFSDEQPRTRRRSHEPRDNEREILQGLQAAANRTIRPNSAGTMI